MITPYHNHRGDQDAARLIRGESWSVLRADVARTVRFAVRALIARIKFYLFI